MERGVWSLINGKNNFKTNSRDEKLESLPSSLSIKGGATAMGIIFVHLVHLVSLIDLVLGPLGAIDLVPPSSALISSMLGRLPFKWLGRDSTNLVI
jgi:hypothetical protein